MWFQINAAKSSLHSLIKVEFFTSDPNRITALKKKKIKYLFLNT